MKNETKINVYNHDALNSLIESAITYEQNTNENKNDNARTATFSKHEITNSPYFQTTDQDIDGQLKLSIMSPKTYRTQFTQNMTTRRVGTATQKMFGQTRKPKQRRVSMPNQRKIRKFHSELLKWRENEIKRTHEHLQRKKLKDDAKFRQRLHMIETNGGVYGEVAATINDFDKSEHCKQCNIFENWTNKVYKPIQKRISQITNDAQLSSIKQEQRKQLYNKYLVETNNKDNPIYLDTINAAKYNPFEWLQYDKKILTKDLDSNDPMKSDLKKYISEQQMEQTQMNKLKLQSLQENSNSHMTNYLTSRTNKSLQTTNRKLNSSNINTDTRQTPNKTLSLNDTQMQTQRTYTHTKDFTFNRNNVNNINNLQQFPTSRAATSMSVMSATLINRNHNNPIITSRTYQSELPRTANTVNINNVNINQTQTQNQACSPMPWEHTADDKLNDESMLTRTAWTNGKYCNIGVNLHNKNQNLTSTVNNNTSLSPDHQPKKLRPFSLKSHSRETLNPQYFTTIGNLPIYKDERRLVMNRIQAPKHVQGGNVLLNQHSIPKYDAKLIRKEYFPTSKRIIKPHFAKYEFNISKQW